MVNIFQKKVLILAIYAGEIMMKNGAEVYRVEDTITRICKACRIDHVEIFATPTGIFVSLDNGGEDDDPLTYVKRIDGIETDLNKISKINHFSREFTTTDLSVDDAMKQLKEIDETKPYPIPLRLLGAALVASFFSLIFGGAPVDFCVAFVVGMFAYAFSRFLGKFDINFFVRCFCSCAGAAFLALVASSWIDAAAYQPVIIGTLMIFVPGVAITNAIRDFLSGSMLSGICRMMEAFLIAVALAAGAGVVLKLWSDRGCVRMSDLLLQFIYALFATCGFAIIFRVPLKHFPVCMIIGGLAWSCYQICLYYNASAVVGCFIAACLVGLLSDICSRVFKEAATIFIIPGMISLVPGYNIYYTMEALLSSELGDAAKVGSQTLLMAGAIAAGLLVIGAVINVIRSIVKKTAALTREKL